MSDLNKKSTPPSLPGPAAGNQKGFTLLEVMVAVAILAIALTSLLGSQSQSMFAATEADFAFASSLLARQKMAEILTSGEAPTDASGDFEDSRPGYSWKVEVVGADFTETELLAGTEDLLRRIDLTIYTDGERRSFTLTRYVLAGGGR